MRIEFSTARTWGAAALVFAFCAGSTVAAMDKPAADADLPPEVRALPYEIRDGYRRFTRRCTGCHTRERVDQASKSLFDWQGVVGAMAFKKGADIPLEDRHPIFLYLSYLQGLKGTAAEQEQYRIFLAKCEDCHGISLVYREKHPLKEWPGIIQRMAGKNRSGITADDQTKILAYIKRIYPDLFGVE